jgi:threonine/homoserine/homoserine lactone efflux protein
MSIILLKGIILGIAISMPMGPISILCIQRTLFYGIKIGLITAIGSALADGVFGSIAAFGLSAIADFLTGYQIWIHVFGGIFLIYLGIMMLRSPPHTINTELQRSTTSLRAFASAFFLTITNPITIFSFMAVFAGLGLGSIHNGYQEAIIMVLGIMIGSTLWEFSLSISIKAIFQHRINTNSMRIINLISGSTILAFAALSFKI